MIRGIFLILGKHFVILFIQYVIQNMYQNNLPVSIILKLESKRINFSQILHCVGIKVFIMEKYFRKNRLNSLTLLEIIWRVKSKKTLALESRAKIVSFIIRIVQLNCELQYCRRLRQQIIYIFI